MHKTKQGTVLKLLTSKKMLQRIPIALVQVKAGNNSENFSNCLLFVSIKKKKKKKKKIQKKKIKSMQL